MKVSVCHRVELIDELKCHAPGEGMGLVCADRYGRVAFDGEVESLEQQLRGGRRPLACQAMIVAKLVETSNGVQEVADLIALHGKLQEAADQQQRFVLAHLPSATNVNNPSTKVRKKEVGGGAARPESTPQPVHVEGPVDERWVTTVEMLTEHYRLFEADRKGELLVAMGAKAGRLKEPLAYQGSDYYALCHVVRLLDEAGAWNGAPLYEVCRRLSTCVSREGEPVPAGSIRTSLPKSEQKRQSLRSTYSALRKLWNVD